MLPIISNSSTDYYWEVGLYELCKRKGICTLYLPILELFKTCMTFIIIIF